MIQDELQMAINDARRGALKYRCHACVMLDTLGQYMDMRLEHGIDMVKICGWTMICRIYIPNPKTKEE